MLEVRRLRLLRELSVHGTLAKVAEVIHQSPSSVSQQLSLLEREIGVELLRKSGRRVQLTPAGELLAGYATEILGLLEQAEAGVKALGDDVSGTIHIAAFQSAALAFMPQLLANLAREHPRLKVSMSQRVPEDALLETRSGEFDLVIAEQYPHAPAPFYAELDRTPLTSDALRLAVPRGKQWNAVKTLRDAHDRPWAMEPRGAASRAWAEAICREVGFEPDIRFETDDLEAQVALVESGNAVVILPGLMSVRRRAQVRWVDLPGLPRREVFTSTRTAIAAAPQIEACRQALLAVVPLSIA
ncbi:MAG TPA: LysR family transcriptional regulator [Marmoricola sp.]|nr:LysR family transcriptional regulator [Marmoricola sp.]